MTSALPCSPWRVVAVVVVVLVALSSTVRVARATPPNPPQGKIEYFTQKYNHSDPSDKRTFRQKYLIDTSTLTNASQPLVFLICGGEAAVRGGWNHDGLVWDMARAAGGALVLGPEHRYYGSTHPFGAASWTGDNIRGLTIDAAVADYVLLLRHVLAARGWKKATTPVITVGGSYPGELAAFMRIAHPDMVDGALASSAPVRYHAGLTPSPAFYGAVTSDLSLTPEEPLGTPACQNAVRWAATTLVRMYNAGAESRRTVERTMRLCDGQLEQHTLRFINFFIENAFAEMAMGDYPWPYDGMPAYPMTAACREMLNGEFSELELLRRYGRVLSIAYNTSGTLTCLNATTEYLPCADATGCGLGTDGVSWDWQSCTQIVANVATNNVSDVFPPYPYVLADIADYCQRSAFVAQQPVPDPTWPLKQYPWLHHGVTHIIWSNGNIDPWSVGGVYIGDQLDEVRRGGGRTFSVRSLHVPRQHTDEIARRTRDGIPFGEAQFSVYYPGAHHLDLRSNDAADPTGTVDARAWENDKIQEWISHFRANVDRQRAVAV